MKKALDIIKEDIEKNYGEFLIIEQPEIKGKDKNMLLEYEDEPNSDE